MGLTSVELCTGAGGQAIGLEAAGYGHEAVVEIDPDCCNTVLSGSSSKKISKE